MDYSEILKIVPSILNLITSMIASYNADKHKFFKKFKGTGFNDKIEALERKLAEIESFRSVLLFYARFLPDAATLHALSDKLYEMVQLSLSSLADKNSVTHDVTWQSISMMYNSIKTAKSAQIVSKRDACPLDSTSKEIQELNSHIRTLESELDRADVALNVRQAQNMLEQAQRISQISSSIRT